MTTQVNTKVRLVRCPKCRLVLAELPGVPLYKCGGCGTVLQAKNRRLETDTTESSSKETDFVAQSREDDLEAMSSNIDSTSQAEIESLSDKDDIRCRDENSDSVELRDDSTVLSISPEVACPPNEDSSIEAKNFPERDSLCQISKRFYDKFRGDHCESSQGKNLLDEVPSSCEFTLEGTKDQMEGGESQRAWRKGDGFIAEDHNSPEHEYSDNASSPEGKIDDQTSRGNNDESWIRFADQHEDFSGEIKPSGIVSREDESAEKNMNTSVCDSNVAYRSPSKESLVSFYLTSPDNENPDNFLSEATRNFRRLGSQDFIGSPSLPTTNYPKVQGYYAYDGSESSYDGNDDQIHERISQPSRRNNTATGEPEWGPTSSSHCATRRNNRWSQSTETSRYAVGNRTRIDEQEGISKLLFPSRMGPGPGSTGYRNGSLPPDLVFRSPYVEPDKIDLLRTVCELKDQLNRMHFQYNQFSPGREVYSDVCHPHRRNLRHNQPEVYSERLPSHYGPQISCSYSHCCPGQDWRYSAHLPPHNSMHRKSGPCGVHIDHTCYNIPNSSSPLRHASSGVLLWGCGIEHEDEIKPTRLKERYFAAKRRIRTVAGGAPMVACYHCSELLLLPVDFLIFTKKYHRLMCNACKKVLRFSVRKGNHIVPYFPGASAPPPPTEADEYNDATRQRNTEPLYHSSSFRRVDPVSCSDDYGNGRSFGMSCSTEGEYYNGKISSGSSYENRKMKSLLTEPRDEDGSLVRGDESAWPPSETADQETGLTRLHCSNMSKSGEVTSRIEETSSSPLHRLMGYSSPSQVLDK